MSDKSAKRIGIFGFGCVGQGLYDVLQDNQRLEVARICVRDKEKLRALPSSIFTYDPQELLQDESIDLFAELISDPAEALFIVRQALKAGKTVVSANKKMVSENLQELVELQLQCGGVLLYEAAVGGSIPILRTLEAYYGSEPLQEVNGILNGSSNYILSKLDAEGSSFQEALEQAQALGFAEADPTLDVEGFDAAHKISIVAAHAFGAIVQPQDILRFGISSVTRKDIGLAQALGARIRLVASAKLNQLGTLEVQVLPTFVYPDSELYYVNAEFNGVQLEAKFAGSQFLKGRGAGSHPTGSAVWADVSAALEGYKYQYPKLHTAAAPDLGENVGLKVYLRTENPELLPCLPWEELTSFGVDAQVAQLIGVIRRKDLLAYQVQLQELGVFVAQVPVNISVDELVRGTRLAAAEVA
ncbi:homoserine dehydrogenase [Pontibacter ummariensis]|uniref:Homoserine dehydrogenase n=1 Tax=Pontibacter ummariensis TaxID=1610492 RepID=A0A239JZU6_9BACT|nr:homoserine dehydrogenase [Pontibacter ummariensis]PRY06803.1 homoserine dehydrogenase [Pontibacter ummariensis]SNT11290.1 homoserine dehydrogenase [Pontibacter ummariensis]